MSTCNEISPQTFKTSVEERTRLLEAAAEVGMTVSSYIRWCLFEEPGTKPRLKPSETKQLVKHLIGHIGRVGNNLNQIAFKLNSDQLLRSVDRAELQEGIRAIKDMRVLLINHLIPRGPC